MIGAAGNNGPFRRTIAETVGRAGHTLFEPRIGTYSWLAGAGVGHGAYDCKWLLAALPKDRFLEAGHRSGRLRQVAPSCPSQSGFSKRQFSG